MISLVHRTDFGPLKVPPQYLMCCTTRLRLWNCSQMKHWMLGLSGMCSSVLLSRIYLVSSPQIGTSSMYGMVVSGISGCRMWVTLSWKMGTEFVHPIGRVMSRSDPNGDWNVVRLQEVSASPCSSYPMERSNIPPHVQPAKFSPIWSL